jgi:hypothetical protein
MFVAYSDRLKFVSGYLSARKEIRKKWRGVTVRTRWIPIEWGERRLLSMTDPFWVPVADIIPAAVSMAHATAEIRAFQKGEPAISAFFDGTDPAIEESRRAKTSLLLAADPNEFAISIALLPGGSIRVVDGHHRLAIAEASELTHIKVVAVLPNLHLGLASSNRALWHWFLVPFSGTRARQ